jgi:hypothetical protein
VIVFPVVLIYTAVVYWIFRGKVRKVAPAYANGAGIGTARRSAPSPRLSSTRQRRGAGP